MKKLLALVLSIMLVCSMFIVGAGAEAAAEKGRVAFICKGYTDTYTYLVMEIFQKYAEETYGDLYTVDYYDGEMSNDTINNLIETCTANKYDVIVFQQNDPDTPVPVVKAAKEAGVGVVVTVGSINDNGETSVYLDADPVQQGAILVDYAVEQGMVKEGSKVAILRGMDGTFHSEGRTQGFRDGLAAIKADVVEDQTAEWSTSKALPIVEGWLISHPEIEYIFACNDDMGLGALQALKAAGREDIKVFSVDANELGCIELINGRLAATVAQDTFGYAHGAADYAAAIIKGEAVESKNLDSKLILKDQAADIMMTVHGYTQDEVNATIDK